VPEYVPPDPFQVKGRAFFNKPFFNIILSTNIAIYKYLADLYFDGDMERIVWASTDMMFRKRQEQLAVRKQNHNPKDTLGILDIPFCSFRLAQDGVNEGTDRNWWNPALNVEGMWIEELGRRVCITPMTLTYEACFICHHDTDLYRVQNINIWNKAKAKETIVESFVDAIGPDGAAHTLKNIIIYDATAHMSTQYNESDFLEKNKLQAITMDIQCQTWAMEEDLHHRYCVTRKVVFDFLEGSGYLPNLIHGDGIADAESQKMVWNIFIGKNESGEFTPIIPKDMHREVHNFTVPPGMPIQNEFDFG
jgi:hypothetical protein